MCLKITWIVQQITSQTYSENDDYTYYLKLHFINHTNEPHQEHIKISDTAKF